MPRPRSTSSSNSGVPGDPTGSGLPAAPPHEGRNREIEGVRRRRAREDDRQRRPSRPLIRAQETDVQARPVSPGRAGPHDHRPGSRPDAVDPALHAVSGHRPLDRILDPAAVAGQLPVGGQRQLERDVGLGVGTGLEERMIQLARQVSAHSPDDLDALPGKPHGATPRVPRRVVQSAVDHAGDPRVGERVAARCGAPGVMAGFECDVDRRAGGVDTVSGECEQGRCLGMGLPGSGVDRLGEQDPIANDTAGDRGIRPGRSGLAPGEYEGPLHPTLIESGVVHGQPSGSASASSVKRPSANASASKSEKSSADSPVPT